ncbi:hypothetical protein ACJ6WF_48560 [Streptomyces sp. MMS24-I2-30]|uniref:hypothetical protein n=1 Tax=Streptomyces sp. MMS24-I2-30 TaxID=3351564 RepID=UPI003896D782
MKANSHRDKKLAFDEVADVYDSARPGIPSRLVTSLVRITGLAPGDQVLLIHPVTGRYFDCGNPAGWLAATTPPPTPRA